MRRMVSIWLPHWPTRRLMREAARRGSPPPAPEGRPLALVERAKGGFRLAALDEAAVQAGLHPGQLLADARAGAPDLVCRAFDSEVDAAALRRLARWCGRWSPDVSLRLGPRGLEGLDLDVAGVTHLFGGEAGLLADLSAKLRALGLPAGIAMADSPGAAWGLARFAPEARRREGVIAAPGAGLAPLLDLPVAALGLEPALEAKLSALGLKRVADVARQSRASLARRFGRVLVDRLAECAGEAPLARDPLRPAPPVRALRRFAEPLLTLEGLKQVAADLAGDLAPELDRRGAGARRLALSLYRVDGERLDVIVGAGRPETCPKRLARLFAERLDAMAERLDLGFGADAAALTAFALDRLGAEVQTLDPEAAAKAGAAAAAALADRLAARLGEGALARLDPFASHLPERAQRLASRTTAPGPFRPPAERPVTLFDPPEPIEVTAELPDHPPRLFRWRRTAHRVALAEGPERIEPEWWAAGGRVRDYYRVETREGRRFWVYREGLYLSSEAPPRWYLHGAFG